MRILHILLLCLLMMLTGCGTALLDSNSSDGLETATVNRVVDGDTVHIQYNGKDETVRLLLVDTPETKHPQLPVQPFGTEASDFAKQTLTGKEVKVEFDGPKRDKYDRMLAYLWVDGKNFNQLLLENGLARYAYVYDPPYNHQEEMEEAEAKAKEAEIGIWSIDGYVTDKGFDHERTEVDPGKSRETNKNELYYNNCTEAHKAGVTPLHKGDPGYGVHMDGDRDGIACE
ncbi:thermonuclease family protein [Gracilibacillus phocaeensis]|uniref:thermonuclease family protein n=1 Tax=Gracilibacillus phocaeensis TaxID=2042304 RepID=UPI001030B88E|nr:thermonuclease family protein [Gracilibacillus phocaeensis]